MDFETNSRKIKLKVENFARFRGKNEEIWMGFASAINEMKIIKEERRKNP